MSATYRGWVGGFVGLIDKAESTVTIDNCVSIGDCSSKGDGSPHVAAPFIAGNGAGEKPNATIYFHSNISNIDALMDPTNGAWPETNMTAGDENEVEYDQQLNVDDLKVESTYTSIGWDFNGIWGWARTKYAFPVLKQFGFVPYEIKTGIRNIEVLNGETLSKANGVFDLSGRRISNGAKLPKGIYIIDGKKVVISN